MTLPSNTNLPIGGIPVNKSTLSEDHFLCKTCEQLLLNPVQLPCCGERLCQYCALCEFNENETCKCRFCVKDLTKDEILQDRGVIRDLKHSTFDCFECQWRGQFQEYKEHLQSTHSNLACPYCNEKFYAWNLVREHIEQFCEECTVSCELIYCAAKIKRKDLDEHYLSVDHQMLMNQLLLETSDENIKRIFRAYFKQNFDERTEEAKSFGDLIPELGNSIESLKKDLEEVGEEYKESNTSLKAISENLGENISSDTDVKTHQQKNKEIWENINGLKSFGDSEPTILLDDQAKAIFPFDTNTTECKHSFKTSGTGVKISLRIYTAPSDDDSGNQKFLSVMLRLEPSEFDSIISYPYCHDFYIVLVDQSRQHDIFKKCIVDRESQALHRPTKNNPNPEFGIKNFFSMKDLQDTQNSYMRDKKIFIGVFIDYLKRGPIEFQFK